MNTLLITYPMQARLRAVLDEALEGAILPVHLPDLEGPARHAALRDAHVVLARNTGVELRAGEAALLSGARLIQFINAGVDFVPLDQLPPDVPLACNRGAYAEPMAEHALAMILCAAKRLLVEHRALARGEFNQFNPNRMLRGMVCGILGFGGIGVAVARLVRAFGMRVHAINRRGGSDEPCDWIGTPEMLDSMLETADVLVIAAPLTLRTTGLIDARALGLMKRDAILLNLARGQIVDEAALYAHLVANPAFFACIDSWWVEPARHGAFRMDMPFTELPNVIGSPHNSPVVAGIVEDALRRAVSNIRRVLDGEEPWWVVTEDERMA